MDQLELELQNARTSVQKLNSTLEEQNQRKATTLNELQRLRERISEKESVDVEKLVSLLASLKGLEKEESVLRSDSDARRRELEADVAGLEGKAAADWSTKTLSVDFDRLLGESVEKLNSAKKDLSARLRAELSIKRKIDDVPTQSELIQYECRSAELNAHIQEKHRETRKYYATYNALLEIKEMMLKETSLLNSISSQFQSAIMSPDGRMKLIDSMEGIVKSTQQKLQKVQSGLQEEQNAYDSLKNRYATAMAEQREYHSLLKAFQEECRKNERLRSQGTIQKTQLGS